MSKDEFQKNRESMKLRLLEVCAEIAEADRRYVVDLLPTPKTTLSTLWAEKKKLELELHKANIILRAEKLEAVKWNESSFISLLVRKCEESGNSHLVSQARSESLLALSNAGLLEAYQSKV